MDVAMATYSEASRARPVVARLALSITVTALALEGNERQQGFAAGGGSIDMDYFVTRRTPEAVAAEEEEQPRRAREQDDEGPAEREPADLAREVQAPRREQDGERGVVEVAEARMARAREVVGLPVAEPRPPPRRESQPGGERDEAEDGAFGRDPASWANVRRHAS